MPPAPNSREFPALRKSAQGFHLPDGDPVPGQTAFVEMRCHSCHSVVGVVLPAPVADPPVPVALGGKVARGRTDGELLTAIIDPSHVIASGYRSELVRSGKLSRMGDFSETMTARQAIDLVAFIHSRYEVVPPRRTPL